MRRISTSDLIYARVLLDLNIDFEKVREMHHIFQQEDKLAEVLENPTVEDEVKYRILDKIFDKELSNFLKMVTANGVISNIRAIYLAYRSMYFQSMNYVVAEVTTAKPLTDKQHKDIENYVKNKFKCDGVKFEVEIDKSLIGGFILVVDDYEYDNSIKGILYRLQKQLIKN